MKRFFGAALCTALALSFLVASLAQAFTWTERSVPFRIQRAALHESDWDSTVVTRGAARTDTTIAFPSYSNASNTITVADTLNAFIMKWAPVDAGSDPNGIAIASGTTTFTFQVSADGGHTWTSDKVVTGNAAVGTGAYSHVYVGHRRYDLYRIIMNSAATGTYHLRIGEWRP